MDKDFDVACLESLKRDRLQKLCKKLKLKANGKVIDNDICMMHLHISNTVR